MSKIDLANRKEVNKVDTTYEMEREFCVQYYVDINNTREQAEIIVKKDPEQVHWLYNKILEDKEKAKHIGIREHKVAGLTIKETYWKD